MSDLNVENKSNATPWVVGTGLVAGAGTAAAKVYSEAKPKYNSYADIIAESNDTFDTKKSNATDPHKAAYEKAELARKEYNEAVAEYDKKVAEYIDKNGSTAQLSEEAAKELEAKKQYLKNLEEELEAKKQALIEAEEKKIKAANMKTPQEIEKKLQDNNFVQKLVDDTNATREKEFNSKLKEYAQKHMELEAKGDKKALEALTKEREEYISREVHSWYNTTPENVAKKANLEKNIKELEETIKKGVDKNGKKIGTNQMNDLKDKLESKRRELARLEKKDVAKNIKSKIEEANARVVDIIIKGDQPVETTLDTKFNNLEKQLTGIDTRLDMKNVKDSDLVKTAINFEDRIARVEKLVSDEKGNLESIASKWQEAKKPKEVDVHQGYSINGGNRTDHYTTTTKEKTFEEFITDITKEENKKLDTIQSEIETKRKAQAEAEIKKDYEAAKNLGDEINAAKKSQDEIRANIKRYSQFKSEDELKQAIKSVDNKLEAIKVKANELKTLKNEANATKIAIKGNGFTTLGVKGKTVKLPDGEYVVRFGEYKTDNTGHRYFLQRQGMASNEVITVKDGKFEIATGSKFKLSDFDGAMVRKKVGKNGDVEVTTDFIERVEKDFEPIKTVEVTKEQAKEAYKKAHTTGLSAEEITRRAKEAVKEEAYKSESEAVAQARKAVEEATAKLKPEAKSSEALQKEIVEKFGTKEQFLKNVEEKYGNELKSLLEKGEWKTVLKEHPGKIGAWTAGAVILGGIVGKLIAPKNRA